MKRIMLLGLFILLLCNVNAQTYYNMWRGSGESGKPEWISNFAMSTEGKAVGIGFITANVARGFVNGYGRWGFLRPYSRSLVPLAFNNLLNELDNLTLGVQGWVYTEGLSVRKLESRSTTGIDFLTEPNKTAITSMGDEQGFHLRSDGGRKIYLYNKVYFNDKNWASLGPGRNNDPTINNTTPTMLRMGSEGGMGFWGNGQAELNDTPHMYLDQDGVLSTGEIRALADGVEIKVGLNNDPTLKCTTDAWLRIGSPIGVAFWSNGLVEANSNPDVLIKDRKLTIGTVSTSSAALNVGGDINAEVSGIRTYIGKDAGNANAWIGTNSNSGLYLGTNGNNGLYMDPSRRNIYIGMSMADADLVRTELKNKYKLFVTGGVLSEDYSIAPKSTWADFVFSKNYPLKAISDVEKFIEKNSHLPDVPSASQVAEEGYSQHDMNKILLQKIEELTLYTIQQQKEIETLKARLDKE